MEEALKLLKAAATLDKSHSVPSTQNTDTLYLHWPFHPNGLKQQLAGSSYLSSAFSGKRRDGSLWGVNQLRQNFTFLSRGIKGRGIPGNINVTINYSTNRQSDRAGKTINSTD